MPDPCPGNRAVSSQSKAQIKAWAKRIKVAGQASESSSDPDYSEFWIELRPKDPTDEMLPDVLVPYRPLSPLFVPKLPRTAPYVTPNGPPQLDVTNLFKVKARCANPLLANWSEEAFGEITPEFAEVVGPDDPSSSERTRRPANAVITIRAIDQGQRLPAGLLQGNTEKDQG